MPVPTTKHAVALLALLLPISAVGEDETPAEALNLDELDAVPALDITQFIDVLSVRATYNGPLDFNQLTRGEIDYTQTSLFAILGLVGKDSDLKWVPALNYRYSDLGVETVNALPRFDDSLHELTLANFLVYAPSGSRWIHGLFTNVGLRSDLGTVDSRDLFVAGAIGSGYRFNDCFTLGFGVYASDLTNDPFVVPAPVFFWTPTDEWLISYYGPRFIARREVGDNVRIGFEAGWNGGSWNIDSQIPVQDSLRVDLRSVRAGLFYRQRIVGELWGEIGAGYSFANELKVRSPGGRDLFPAAYGETDGAPYFTFGLSVNRW